MKTSPAPFSEKFTGRQLNPSAKPFTVDDIPNDGILPAMIESIPIDKITSGTLPSSTKIDFGVAAIDGSAGLYAKDILGAYTWLLAPDGSGFFGNGLSWTNDGDVTMQAAKVIGELEAATIKADKLLTSELYADIGIFGNLYAGTLTQEGTRLGVDGLQLYNSLHALTGHLKTDGTGWLGGENEFAWNDNGVLIWKITTGYLQSDVSPNPRIVIDHTEIAGYSDATTKQFYLQASDGKAYFGGGNGIIAADGVTINYPAGFSGAYLTMKYNGELHGYVSAGLRGAIPSLNITGKNNGDDAETEVLIQASNGQTPVGVMQPYIRVHADGSQASDYAGIKLYCEDKSYGHDAQIEIKSFYNSAASTIDIYAKTIAFGNIYPFAPGMVSIDGATGKATFGTGASAATWPSAHFGDPDLGFYARGTSAAPVASGKAVVSISDYTSGDWDDANMGALMVYSRRTGGSSNGLMVGTESGAKGKATCGIQSYTLISTGTGAGAGDHASASAGWFSGQLWDVYDRLSVVMINPVNASGSNAPDAGEYGTTAMLSNALALVAAGSKQSSSALYIGTQNTTTSQFQRGIDFKQASIANYAIVLPNNAPVVSRNAADNAKVELYRLDASNNWGVHAMTLTEQTAPSAPAANQVTIYAVDNGAGKTQLMALFSSGAAQQLAIQP